MKEGKFKAKDLIEKCKFQIICDPNLVDEWGSKYRPDIEVYIQEYEPDVCCRELSDQEAPVWIDEIVDLVCPHGQGEILESVFIMPANEFRDLVTIADSVVWLDRKEFKPGEEELTPDEIEAYIELFKK